MFEPFAGNSDEMEIDRVPTAREMSDLKVSQSYSQQRVHL